MYYDYNRFFLKLPGLECKLQELLAVIAMEGGMEPVMTMNAIVFC
jgi:hypothetical protein